MTGLLGDIIQETILPTKSSRQVTISLHFSRMHMHTLENVILAKGVVEDNPGQQHP